MRTRDGLVLTGTTPKEIVASLHGLAFEPQDSDRVYMAEAARMAEIQSGKKIRHDSAEHFVADLLQAGLLVDGDKPPEADKPPKPTKQAGGEDE